MFSVRESKRKQYVICVTTVFIIQAFFSQDTGYISHTRVKDSE